MKVTEEMIEVFKRYGHPLPFEPNIEAGLQAVLDLIDPPMPDLPGLPDWSDRPRAVRLEIESLIEISVLDMGEVSNPRELVAALRYHADEFEREMRKAGLA